MAALNKESVNLSQWNKKGDFQVVVGIDFGTDGSGVAWAMKDGNGEVFVDQEINGNAQFVDVKTKTNILLEEDGEFIAFGREATEKYIRQIQEDDDSDDESDIASNKKSASWLYFSQFKMALYKSAIKKQALATKQGPDDNEVDEKKADPLKADIKRKIKAANGRKLESKKVFVAALTFMKEYAFNMFERHNVDIADPSKIKWVLTVPAIWSDTSKGLMEGWAVEAGLITDRKVLNQLVIAYEPDCASISIRHELLSMMMGKKKRKRNESADEGDEMKEEIESGKKQKQYLGANEKYLLLDLGGGTADIACHQVVDDCTVKEVYQPSGGRMYRSTLNIIDPSMNVLK